MKKLPLTGNDLMYSVRHILGQRFGFMFLKNFVNTFRCSPTKIITAFFHPSVIIGSFKKAGVPAFPEMFCGMRVIKVLTIRPHFIDRLRVRGIEVKDEWFDPSITYEI